MELEKRLSKRTFYDPLICYICGDIARGMNFNVITCMSCKAFFRRHALRSGKKLHCLLNNNCEITKETRGGCAACRLEKCFSLGMNPNLIRSCYTKQMKQSTKTVNISQPQTLSLLKHDRSTLTLDEWNLLSNIVHAYDEQNLIVRTQCCLKEQLSLPPKIRAKTTNTLELIGSFYTAMQPFIERSSYFHTIPSGIRKFIIQNNLNGAGAFNTMLAAAEANVFDNECHVAVCNEIYGADYTKESYRLLTRIESNRTLLKVMLMILAFSNNCSIVRYDPSINWTNLSATDSYNLNCIQNIFITMLWKYLVYQYGFIEAVKHFAYVIKNYLDVLTRTDENVSVPHKKMVDIIVEKTTYSLVLNK